MDGVRGNSSTMSTCEKVNSLKHTSHTLNPTMLNSWHASIMGEFSLIVNDTNICITHIYILEIRFFFFLLYMWRKIILQFIIYNYICI